MINISKEFIEECLRKTENLESKLPTVVSQRPGFSTQKVRHLLNNLCNFNNAKYLNCGLLSGSSFWSAIFHNSIKATGIDYWRSPDTAKQTEIEFWNNLSAVLSLETETVNREINIICQDCFTVDLKDKYNVYFYDANHSFEGQYNALEYFDKFLEDEFIFVVDDFDNDIVSFSTNKAIQELKYDVKFRWEGKGSFGDWNPSADHYWNGILVCWLSKKI